MPSFFDWHYANKQFRFEGVSFTIFYLVFSLSIICGFLLWFFKRPINRWFNSKERHLGFLSKRALFATIGSLIIVFMATRSTFVLFNNYPFPWEVLPFHLCRLMLLFLGLCLVFNRLELVKYFGAVALIGAFIALVNPSFEFEKIPKGVKPAVGLDSVFYYDYILIHNFLFLGIMSAFVIHKMNFKAKHLIIQISFFLCLALFMFGINWLTSLLTKDVKNPHVWQTNYLYLGKDEVNAQKNIFGPASHWPYNLISWSVVGIIACILATCFWLAQDSIFIDKINNKWVFKYQKTSNFKNFMSSFKEIRIRRNVCIQNN